MEIIKNLKVPTGNICIAKGEKGSLEFLSIGDYGREKNLKADFLGLTDEINGVPNGEIMSLEEKWVVTISTQYGCSMSCKFCDVPKIQCKGNATYSDLEGQITEALKLHPEVYGTKRFNLHYARMGEPTFNPDVLKVSYDLHKIVKPYIGNSMIHPVISTMLPKNNLRLNSFLTEWCSDIKNRHFRGDAGLQFSINSTDNKQRDDMFSGQSKSLKEISEIGEMLEDPIGRKYTLNFALADDYIVDAKLLASMFDPNKFITKITPLHKTTACITNDIKTTDGYDQFTPYKEAEEALKAAGFNVIVFVPSYEEDLGLITCGNLVLSGAEPGVPYQLIK